MIIRKYKIQTPAKNNGNMQKIGVDYMKNIVVFDGNREFKAYLKKQLDLLNIKLDIRVYNDEFDEYYDYIVINNAEAIDKYKDNISGKYLLINMDMLGESRAKFLGNIITYGLGNKNTVTVSSMEKDNGSFVYCLQRALVSNESFVIQPEEIPIERTFKDNYELYSFMATITIGLIEGIESENIRKYFN